MKKTEETKNTEGIKRKELVKKIENSQTVQKGKKGISSVIFGRTFLVFFSLFLQLIFMVWGYYWLASKWYFVNGVVTVLGVLEVIYVANERSNPAFKLALDHRDTGPAHLWKPFISFCGNSAGYKMDQQAAPEHACLQ